MLGALYGTSIEITFTNLKTGRPEVRCVEIPATSVVVRIDGVPVHPQQSYVAGMLEEILALLGSAPLKSESSSSAYPPLRKLFKEGMCAKLRRAGYENLEAVAACKAHDLLGIYYFGPVQLEIVEGVLKQHGLKLAS